MADPAYFAYPKTANPKKAIILITDVFGIVSNSQLLADDFARNGYLAVIPDILNNDSINFGDWGTSRVNFPAWIAKHGPETVEPAIEATIKHLREELGVEKIGTAGYCYGGRFVVSFLKNGKTDAGYTAHPTAIQTGQLAAIEKPLSIAAAEIDTVWPTEHRHEAEGILSKTGQPYQINVYGGVQHGFAARGDMSNAHLKTSKELAFLQALNWFQYYL
ncbi:uncharacterized protein TRUGW13939_10546 [Talaromyces rugulosus]|uniref:Dienelactone hydrolase domain-containing protein n=1 Tax=Talaromyces rugulosus TaxID=121627 RepID=A0A7H8RAQ7_TALRU|nr:uncharacterized protein TRUGW13939_10546 [Talaromyces rugulosus]QKX63376.1 hypothetical protein TRUGW13939_10546 [Talaromyces rugulosus]